MYRCIGPGPRECVPGILGEEEEVSKSCRVLQAAWWPGRPRHVEVGFCEPRKREGKREERLSDISEGFPTFEDDSQCLLGLNSP